MCLSGLAGEAWLLVLPGARDNRKVHVPLPARATSTWLIADRGCSTVQSYVQLDRVLMDYKLYSDVEGALEPTWRRGDSG